MIDGLSFLSLAATVLYSGVALSCMAAAGTAVKARQPRWNLRVWIALAGLFVLLLVLRGFGIEEWIRTVLREWLRADGSYSGRRFGQGLSISAVLLVLAAVFFWLVRSSKKVRGRRNIATMAALVSGGAMIVLIVLRTISLHMIDTLLYGPFKLNWVVDIGSSFVVLGAAAYYHRVVQARP